MKAAAQSRFAAPTDSSLPPRGGILQRKCACGRTPGSASECEEYGEKQLQRKARNSELETSNESSVPPIVHEVLRSPGHPLDAEARAFMEPRFRHDFSNVRVHTDAKAAKSALTVNAYAYTVGRDIVFGSGQFRLGTEESRRLLAHELAHVVQSASQPVTSAVTMDRGPSDSSEQAANQAAQRVVSGKTTVPVVSGHASSLPLLQRYAVPSNLACNEIVDWLNANSPYAPEWAETRCNYTFSGNASVSTSQQPGGTVTANVRGHNTLTVAVNCPIDRPEWNPSRRPNRDAEVAAWRAMRTTLDGHEADHRRIGQTWRSTLEGRYRAINFSVTGVDQADAMANARTELTSRQQTWMADAQAAQDAIDPFRGAVLTCP